MKNKQFYNLYLDFEELRKNGIYPCDIDMFYECQDGYLIIGEAKFQGYHTKGKQEQVLTDTINGHKQGGVLMEIEHMQRVQDGAESVNVANCLVRRAYFNSEWHEYKSPLNVLKWMQELKKKHGYA